MSRNLLSALSCLLLSLCWSNAAGPMSTAFTYQGRLAQGNNPANGIYDLQFAVYDTPTGGSAVGTVLSQEATPVTNGLFTVALDFGAVFDGNARWLEIAVRTNGGGSYVTLTPRQELSGAPYAQYAPNAGNASRLNGLSASAFAANQHLLFVKVAGDGSGTVSSSPAGIACGGTCVAAFAPGTVVNLTALFGADSSFQGWSGAVSGTATNVTVLMDSAKSVVATFTRRTFDLTVTRTAGGAVVTTPGGVNCGAVCQASFPYGTVVQAMAVAEPGFVFSGWGGAASGSVPTTSVIMDSSRTLTATFTGTAGFTGNFAGNGAALTNVPGTLVWQETGGTNLTAQPGTGYLLGNLTPAVINLSPTAQVGEIIQVSSVGLAGWSIQASPGQLLHADGAPGFGIDWSIKECALAGEDVYLSPDTSRLLLKTGSQLFVSTNQAANWVPVATNEFASLVPKAVSRDGRLIVGNGIVETAPNVYENGWFISTNSGNTWSQMSNSVCPYAPPYSTYLTSPSYFALSDDGSTVAACYTGQYYTEFYAVVLSRDYGATWTWPPAPTLSGFRGFSLSPDGNTVYLAGTNVPGQVVAFSSDGTKMLAFPSDYGQNPLYVSRDSGKTWSAGPTNFWFDAAMSSDGMKMFAGGYYGVWASIDMGQTWSRKSSATTCPGLACTEDGTTVAAVRPGGGTNAVWLGKLSPRWTSVSSLSGDPGSAIQLQCIGSNEFRVIKYSGPGTLYASTTVAAPQSALDAKVSKAGDTMTGPLANPSGFIGLGSGLTGVDAERLQGNPASAFAWSNHQHDASSVISGTLADERLSGNVALLNSAPAFSGTVTAPGFSGSGADLSGLNGSQVTSGTVMAARIDPAVARTAQVWLRNGNLGTDPGADFIGTLDNQPLAFRVNGQPVLSLGVNNSVGMATCTNAGSYSVALGPFANGGGYASLAAGYEADASGDYSVALGRDTKAGGLFSTALGNNTVSTGTVSTAMGMRTVAGGLSSLAAGFYARALHDYSFVWSDAAVFESTRPAQFLIHAANGVGINTNDPQSALHVAGTVTATAFSGSGAGLSAVNADTLDGQEGAFYQNAGNLNAGTVADARLGANVARTNQVWLLNGNAGTTATDYLGTADAQPLRLGAAGQPVVTVGTDLSVASGNASASGLGSHALGQLATAKGEAAIALGYNTRATNSHAFAAGENSTASGWASIAMGQNNVSSGYVSMALGRDVTASGAASLAVGQGASALANWDFVWSDGTDFQSTADCQFLIHAVGGVGIGTNAPKSALHVAGTVTATAFSGNGAGLSTVNADTLDGQHGAFYQNAGNLNVGTLPDARLSGNVALLSGAPNFSGAVTAPTFAGSGANLTSLNASSLASGTIPDARLSANVAMSNTNQTFTASNVFLGVLTATNASNVLAGTFNGNASGLTNLNASRLNGVVAVANGGTGLSGVPAAGSYLRSSGSVWTGSPLLASDLPAGSANYIQNQNAAAQVANLWISGTASAGAFAGSGANLTALNASSLAIGTVADARLSTNVARLNASQTFTGVNSFAGMVGIGTTAPTDALLDVEGDVRLNMNDLFLRDGNDRNHGLGWYGAGKLFSGQNIDGPVLYGWTGGALGTMDPAARAVLSWNKSGCVGIGTSNPTHVLHIHDSSTNTLRLTGSGLNLSGAKMNFGDGEYVYLHEVSDDVLRIQATRLGIARTATGNRFEVEGEASKTTAGSWLANSDARIKRDIESITNALDKLAQVRLVSFRYTEEYRQQHPSVEERPYVNVVAQEFQQVFPDAVKGSGEKLADGSEILQVDTYPLTIYSAAAVQELNRKVEQQAALLQARDAKIQSLEERLAALEKLLSAH